MRIYPKVFNQRRKELKNSEYTANNIRSSSVKSQPMTRETKCVHTSTVYVPSHCGSTRICSEKLFSYKNFGKKELCLGLNFIFFCKVQLKV